MSTYQTRINILQILNPQIRRIDSNLPLHNLHRAFHALVPIHVRIRERSPETDRSDPKSKQLDNVGPVSYASVGVNLNLVEYFGRFLMDLQSYFERGRGGVELTTSVI